MMVSVVSNVTLDPDPKKLCPSCNKEKSIKTEFHKNKSRNDGLQCHCKTCFRDRYSSSTLEDRRKANLLRSYRISWDTYLRLIQDQDYRCAICGVEIGAVTSDGKETAQVDHDHETGQIRGVLCHTCNSGIGLFKENPTLLERAISYLHSPKPIVERLSSEDIDLEKRHKLSIAATGKVMSEKVRAALSASHKGVPNPKSGASRKGKPLSEEHRLAVSVGMKTSIANRSKTADGTVVIS